MLLYRPKRVLVEDGKNGLARFLLGTADLVMDVLGEPEGTLFDNDDDNACCNPLPSESCLVSDDETSHASSSDEPDSESTRSLLGCPAEASLPTSVPVKEIQVATTSASPKKKAALDYLTEKMFHIAGLLFATCISIMLRYFLQTIGTDTGIALWEEFRDGLQIMFLHNHGIPFMGMLGFMKVSQYVVNTYIYPLVLKHIYDGTNEKYTGYYCDWLLEASKKTIMFSIGVYVAFGSDWVPLPSLGTWYWIPKQGGTIFNTNGDIVPTCAIALETIGHLEALDDFVSLIVLLYDRLVEWWGTGDDDGDEEPKKAATSTTSFAEDFVHHTGVVIAAFFIYVVAKDNCNAVAVIVLLAQVSDFFEYSILVLGICKNWFLERVVTPIVMFLWTIAVLYVWPAVTIPIALEPIPIEHSFDQHLVLSLTMYQIACVLISLLFWAMHVVWLYKSFVFMYKYHHGVYSKSKSVSAVSHESKPQKADLVSREFMR